MSENTQNILLTGVTGEFGRFLALELMKDKEINLFLLVRSSSDEEARQRVSEIIDINDKRVSVFKSSLSEDGLGLSKEDYSALENKITHIIHSAASTRFNLSLDDARLANVNTTESIIDFAKKCPKLKRFAYISTAFVSGKRRGVIKEGEFEHNEGFSNSYQESKYEAEALVRVNMDEIKGVIFRPPFIVSPSSKDFTQKPNFLSILISLVAKGNLPCVPGTEESMIDLVSSVEAAEIIIKFLLKDNLSYNTYHITNGSLALDLKTFHQIIGEKIGKSIPVEYCGDVESFNKRLIEVSKARPEIIDIYKKGESFLLEPAYSKVFDNSRTLEELGISRLKESPIDILKFMIKDKSWNS